MLEAKGNCEKIWKDTSLAGKKLAMGEDKQGEGKNVKGNVWK